MEVKKSKKRVTLSRLGKDDNVLINHRTGEHLGTQVCTFRQVDSEGFVKLFSRNIGLIFDLKSAGIKVLTLVVWAVQNKAINKDLIALDNYTLNDYLEETRIKNLSQRTFYSGLKQLQEAKILAKNIRAGYYYINPSFIFNGDRIIFSEVVERIEK